MVGESDTLPRIDRRMTAPSVSRILPDSLVDPPEPEGLKRIEQIAQQALDWITDTGAVLRKSLTPAPVTATSVTHDGPYNSPLGAMTRFAMSGLLMIEIVLLWGIQL